MYDIVKTKETIQIKDFCSFFIYTPLPRLMQSKVGGGSGECDGITSGEVDFRLRCRWI